MLYSYTESEFDPESSECPPFLSELINHLSDNIKSYEYLSKGSNGCCGNHAGFSRWHMNLQKTMRPKILTTLEHSGSKTVAELFPVVEEIGSKTTLKRTLKKLEKENMITGYMEGNKKFYELVNEQITNENKNKNIGGKNE